MLMNKLGNTSMLEISEGNFHSINEFLNKKIWSIGSLKDTNSLIKNAVGEDKINPIIFLDYLLQKYQK